jgi:MFS family permease
MIPILFGAAGRVQGMTPGLGIAAVATTGYTGLLAGPPLIGMTAELVGLRLALVAIVCGVLVIAVFAGAAGSDTTSRPEKDRGETLTRLAALGTLSRGAGEGLGEGSRQRT